MPGNPISSRPEAASAASLPGIPLDSGEPLFREPWEAQAFAMALALHERGVFTWAQWAAALAEEIRSAQAAGDPDLGTTYYRHWLAALEHLVAATGIASPEPMNTDPEKRHGRCSWIPGSLRFAWAPGRRPHTANMRSLAI